MLFCGAVEQRLEAAQSRSPDPRDKDEIVVTGARSVEATIDTVRELGIVETGGQYAGWRWRPCPQMIGWEPEHAAMVKARIDTVVERYFPATANAACTPNVGIILSSDPGAVLARIKKAMPRTFAQFPSEMRRIAQNDKNAVRVLLGVNLVNRDGRPIYQPEALRPPPGLEVLAPLSGAVVQGVGIGNSRIGKTVRRDYTAGIVVVDVTRINGATFEALADHIALRVLTGAREGAPDNVDSVLGLFEALDADQSPPTGLTDWDVALLGAYQDAPAADIAAAQIGSIARHMVKDLQQDAPPEE